MLNINIISIIVILIITIIIINNLFIYIINKYFINKLYINVYNKIIKLTFMFIIKNLIIPLLGAAFSLTINDILICLSLNHIIYFNNIIICMSNENNQSITSNENISSSSSNYDFSNSHLFYDKFYTNNIPAKFLDCISSDSILIDSNNRSYIPKSEYIE